MCLSLTSLFLCLLLSVMPNQHGRVAIVTGGARGIGYEIARHMASLGAHVIIGTVFTTTPGTVTHNTVYDRPV